ncbi:MAG: polymerase [Acidobacteriota bacterium]|nr:polymerase [Acidobacteriota bacterium]
MWERRADTRATRPLQLTQNGRVPVPLILCRVPAGFPSPADDYVERTIDLNEWLIGNELATFIVRAEGDSMTGEIHSGDRLIVDRSLEARHRDVVVACLDGEMIVKRLLVRDGRYYLQPENTSYPLIEITEERELIIWGVVTHSIHPLR